jgi:hypothetical protein
LIIAISALIILAAGGWLIAASLHKPDKLPVKLDNSRRYGVAPAKAAAADTPFGQTAGGSGGAAGIAVNVNQVIPNPPVSGDASDAGTHYVEIDLTIYNSNRRSTIVPGTFVYRTAAGQLLNTADSVGKGPAFPGKLIELAGKQPVTGLSLKAGQTDDSAYLVYQLPAGETGGKLVWFDGYYDTHSTKLAVFDLN